MKDLMLALIMFVSIMTVMAFSLTGLSNTQTNIQKIVSDLNGVK